MVIDTRAASAGDVSLLPDADAAAPFGLSFRVTAPIGFGAARAEGQQDSNPWMNYGLASSSPSSKRNAFGSAAGSLSSGLRNRLGFGSAMDADPGYAFQSNSAKTRMMGPSSAACQENSKAQWGAIMKIERRGQSVRETVGVADHDGQMQARTFQEDALAVDQLIQSIQNVRKDPRAAAEERNRLEQGEAKRQHELEMQRARRREQEVRDPHKKIALKLENRRRFESGGLEGDEMSSRQAKKTVPTRKVDFIGLKGVEQVDLVDVTQLRAKCQHFSEGQGVSVKAMLDRQKHMEQARSPCPVTVVSSRPASCPERRPISTSSSSPSLGDSGNDEIMLRHTKSSAARTGGSVPRFGGRR